MNQPSVADLKSQMLAAIREVAASMGILPGDPGPGRGTFLSKAGYAEYDLTRCGWVNWSDALAEAGFRANSLQAAIPREMLLEHLARLTREIGRFPTNNHIRVATKTVAGFPSLTTFAERLGSQSELQRLLGDWCSSRPEYADISAILETGPVRNARRSDENVSVVAAHEETLSDSYVPPVIGLLSRLASGDPVLAEACRRNRQSQNSEFERRVGIAFAILGFQMEELGQGKGAVADGIAKYAERQWAVIYDAKVRGSGYRLLTEDRRKFRDYINVHERKLSSEGIRRIYFAVISSGFSSRDLERAREVKSGSDARSCVLIEAAALVALVERKIREPRHVGIDSMEAIFEETRIVTKADVV